MAEPSGGGDEVFGGSAVALDEVTAGAHEVDEIVGGIDPGDGTDQRGGVLDVAADDLHPRRPRSSGHPRRVADHDPHLVALFQQQRDQTAADVAGCAGDQDLHACSPYFSR